MKKPGTPNEYACDNSAGNGETPCQKCRKESSSACCSCRVGYTLNPEFKEIFRMLSDAVQRQRRLERFVLVIAQCLQKDDPERNVALDSRVLPAIKRTMVEEAVNRLLNTNEKPMLVLKEVFDSYKACAGAYENKAHFKRQVFRRLRKALIR